jgi:hypothetical protein
MQGDPVRWYHILSTWIFIFSCLQPLHGLPTFPLNIFASAGCLEVVLNPHKEHWLKNAYIIFIHVAPFTWVPYDLSSRAFIVAALAIGAYLAFMAFLRKNPIDSYRAILNEDHRRLDQFLEARFGIRLSS